MEIHDELPWCLHHIDPFLQDSSLLFDWRCSHPSQLQIDIGSRKFHGLQTKSAQQQKWEISKRTMQWTRKVLAYKLKYNCINFLIIIIESTIRTIYKGYYSRNISTFWINCHSNKGSYLSQQCALWGYKAGTDECSLQFACCLLISHYKSPLFRKSKEKFHD